MSKTETEWDLLQHEVGYIAEDFYEQGVRVLIMRGPAAWCAYVGIPSDHPLANFNYDDIPISCHGGFTFGGEGKKKSGRSEGWYWYGWDYAHCDDKCAYDVDDIGKRFCRANEKAWTAKEVKQEAIMVAWDFARLKKLAERIKSK